MKNRLQLASGRSERRIQGLTLGSYNQVWKQASNAQDAGSGTRRVWMSQPGTASPIWKIARYAANRTCCGWNMT